MKRWTLSGAPTAAQIGEISEVLRAGGVVLMPTDTIYGLHALATEEMALRMARIKGRDDGKRFVTIAASIAEIESAGAEVPPVLHEIWPAPLTAVLARGSETIAARVPDLAWLHHLLVKTGPLLSTSANRAGVIPISDPDMLESELRDAIDGIVDAGHQEGKASAIVDFTSGEPRFIRNGDPRFAQILRKTLLKNL